MVPAVISGCCVAVALALSYRCVRRQLISPHEAAGTSGFNPSTTVILQMIAVAVRQGASIPRALAVIGESLGNAYGAELVEVSRALHRGTAWREAWVPSLAGEFSSSLSLICDALEDSWNRGTSPLGRLDDAIGQVRAHRRTAIERGASRLTIRLLLPTGLCFLPAFILIGVIPSIGSFVV